VHLGPREFSCGIRGCRELTRCATGSWLWSRGAYGPEVCVDAGLDRVERCITGHYRTNWPGSWHHPRLRFIFAGALSPDP
jgi:hypothetical protein